MAPVTLTPAKLREIQARADNATEEQSAKIQAEIRKFFTRYIKDVKALLNGQNISNDEKISILQATQIAQDFDDVFEEAGWSELQDEYRRSYLPVTTDALDYFENLGITDRFAGIGPGIIDGLIAIDVEELDRTVNRKLVQPLKDSLVAGVISQKPYGETVDQITDIIDSEGILRRDGKQFTDANIEVLVSDSHARFHRTLRALKAEGVGFSIVHYVGPLDGKTRDSCRTMLQTSLHGVPGMYYADEFNTSLHPDLSEDPRIAGGGFNCRHNAWEVSLEYAVSQGFIPREGELEELEVEAA